MQNLHLNRLSKTKFIKLNNVKIRLVGKPDFTGEDIDNQV